MLSAMLWTHEDSSVVANSHLDTPAAFPAAENHRRIVTFLLREF